MQIPKNQPKPLFDKLGTDTELNIQSIPFKKDYSYAALFLNAYQGSPATYNAYRREIERLLQWAWLKAKQSIFTLKRTDIEKYIHFCQTPPKSWIGIHKVPRFIIKDSLRIANPKWRPFVATISKSARRQGQKPNVDDYELSNSAVRDIFSILSSFYQFLIQEDTIEYNPVSQIRQKNQYIRRKQGARKIRRLSDTQWFSVISIAEQLANTEPDKHERTLFIMSLLYSLYLRISELAANTRWEPTMNDFWQDADGGWWFTTVGKGNKERQISVSPSILQALKRWRTFLNLSPLPTPADTYPLLPKIKGRGAITSTTYIREIVQNCFDEAILSLKRQNEPIEAANLNQATVHWLRHTGISEDVKVRPREHVREDAGHSSSAITDKYIDVELKERHRSAQGKVIKKEPNN
jgi:integrase